MANASGRAPRQFRVLKDNGEWWTMSFDGRGGVRWDRSGPPVETETSTRFHEYAEATAPNNPLAEQWAEFFADLLMEALKAARPHIEEWLRYDVLPHLKYVVLPQVKMTARDTWNRITRKNQVTSLKDAKTEQAHITDIPPSSAVAFSEQNDEYIRAHNLNLTPEEARKQLADMKLLTRILAARVRSLTSALERRDGESDVKFVERREQAEQLALRNVTLNVRAMLEHGAGINQAIATSANYAPAFTAGQVQIASLRIESLAAPELEHPRQG